MSVHGQGARRALAIGAGVATIAAGAAPNVTHLIEGGQPLVSPMTGAVLALAIGAVAAALVANEAWRSGRKILASCLVASVVAGEGFGLIMGAERLLSAREERQRAAAMTNTARWTATVRFEAANSALAAAEAAMLKEAGRGGCKGACQALQVEAGREEQGIARRNPGTPPCPGRNRAGFAVFHGLERACVHAPSLRSARAEQIRFGAGSTLRNGAASAFARAARDGQSTARPS
jgi:hypothetical protein